MIPIPVARRKIKRPVNGVKVEKKTSSLLRLLKPNSRKQSRRNLNSPSVSYMLTKPNVEKKITKKLYNVKVVEPIGPHNTPVFSKKLYRLVNNQKVPVIVTGGNEAESRKFKGRILPGMSTKQTVPVEPQLKESKGKIRARKTKDGKQAEPKVREMKKKIPAWMIDETEPAEPELRRLKEKVSEWIREEAELKRNEESHLRRLEYSSRIFPSSYTAGDTEPRPVTEPALSGFKGLRAKFASGLRLSADKLSQTRSKEVATQTNNPKLHSKTVQTYYSAIENF